MTAPVAAVWTPWADVLCRICYASKLIAAPEIKWPGPADATTAPDRAEWREGDGPGFCTECGGDVWVHDEIAQLTRLRKLVGGEMQQTGGMCAALAIPHVAGGTVAVTNMNGTIDIGLYYPKDWDEGGEVIQMYCLPFSTPDDAAAGVIRAAMTEPMEEKQ